MIRHERLIQGKTPSTSASVIISNLDGQPPIMPNKSLSRESCKRFSPHVLNLRPQKTVQMLHKLLICLSIL